MHSKNQVEVTQEQEWKGKVVVIEGDLVIKGALDLTNTELRVSGKIIVSGIWYSSFFHS